MYNNYLRVPVLTDGAEVALRRLFWHFLKKCEQRLSMKIDALETNPLLLTIK